VATATALPYPWPSPYPSVDSSSIEGTCDVCSLLGDALEYLRIIVNILVDIAQKMTMVLDNQQEILTILKE
jgi:hypothetical protein